MKQQPGAKTSAASSAAEGWVAIELLYPSLEARARLIAELLPRLPMSAPGSWYFVDIDVDIGDGPRPGVEVAVQKASCATADFSAWVYGAFVSGLIERASQTATPSMFAAELFPAGVMPSCYPAVLWVGSMRAAEAIAAVDRGMAAPEPIAACELLAIYRALVPKRFMAAACRAHAEWLEAADSTAVQTASHEPAYAQLVAAALALRETVPGDDDYRRFRPALAGYAMSVARRIFPPEQVGAGHHKVRDAVVARLAHIQRVRIRGPQDRGGTRSEAALVRGLANACNDAKFWK